MADVRRKSNSGGTTAKKSAKKKARVLYTLSADELLEYQNRHRLLMQKQMEYHATSNYMEIFQNALIEEHGLPIKFNLNIETGIVTELEREQEGDALNVENGRV